MRPCKQVEEVVRKAVHLFFEKQSFEELNRELAEDITWIATGGRELGKQLDLAYRYFLEETHFTARELSIVRETHQVQPLNETYARVTSFLEVCEKRSGKKQRLHITMLVRQEAPGWKIFHVHSSLYLADVVSLHSIEQKLSMCERIRRAIDAEELKLYVQPQFDIRTQKILSGEVLVRWKDAHGRVIGADRFLPLLEKEGGIRIVDMYVLEQLCRMMAQWREEGSRVLPMAVNQSAGNLGSARQHMQRFTQIVDAYHIPHELITYEVTETALLGRDEQISRMFTELRQQGFTVSVDDFGSGYATFQSLHIIHPDELKLDQSLLRERKKDAGMEIVIRKIIEMAHELKMSVVCEGIEDREQLEFLKQTGCDKGQGYLISRPVPIEEFSETYLTRWIKA